MTSSCVLQARYFFPVQYVLDQRAISITLWNVDCFQAPLEFGFIFLQYIPDALQTQPHPELGPLGSPDQGRVLVLDSPSSCPGD